MCFFFFKQKTAYEMRISDWSSDVCSSDLRSLDEGNRLLQPVLGERVPDGRAHRNAFSGARSICVRIAYPSVSRSSGSSHGRRPSDEIGRAPSELQSLMRISYAVFCLKKKKKDNRHKYTTR